MTDQNTDSKKSRQQRNMFWENYDASTYQFTH